ncbi:hypothetical protein EDB81DRAFT_952888 [Dactylonectria macrodidyma]|uniref:RelA/SpoT domain-containing protein n=1 Tax=Dactylonectria macrodidyma TaxID=307937 RepID=A0A9P9DE18_9HYPO|nr:hypothetical protein EDB81DRAFT_952888 [Dactylonectria macrodidyma]
MSSQSSTLSMRSNPNDPLHIKIERMIHDAPGNDSPKKVFTENIWPRLEDEYGMMVQELSKYCERQLYEKCIPAKIEGRVKSLDSIEKSLERREKHRIEHQKNQYENLGEIFYDMHDLAGIRIVVDYPSDIDKVNQFINRTFQPTKEPNVFSSDRQVGHLWKPWFGAYKSCNHHVALKPETVDVLQSYCHIYQLLRLKIKSQRLGSLINRSQRPGFLTSRSRRPGSLGIRSTENLIIAMRATYK